MSSGDRRKEVERYVVCPEYRVESFPCETGLINDRSVSVIIGSSLSTHTIHFIGDTMHTDSLVFLFWLLLGVDCGDTAELSGIYVNKQAPHYRIEFLPESDSFICHPYYSRGTFTKEKGTCICKNKDGKVRFRLKGKILVDQDGNEWIPRTDFVKIPWKDLSPVTMVVLDRKTRRPITKFTYEYKISTAKAEYDPLLVRPIEVKSDDGTFTLLAPDSCEIEICIEGETILGGFGSWRQYDLTAGNKKRRIEVLVETGVRMTGVVVDARTGKPIEGAIVSPVIFTPPSFSPDRDRAVKTDAKGEFTIQGVNHTLGINVRHPDYFEFNHNGFTKVGELTGKNTYTVRIELKSGERLMGVVKDPSGKPLANVKVSDSSGKHVRTGSDGSFVLASARKWLQSDSYNLSFRKDGYLDGELHPESADPQGFTVVLQPQPVLAGRVLDSTGQPVGTYQVMAGAGLEPRPWKCSSDSINNNEGHFSLRVRPDWDYDDEGKVWIGVKAPGFAVWETTVNIWQGTKTITARLKPGVAVHGTIKNPKDRSSDISATLLPCRLHQESLTRETSQRQELGRMKTVIDRSGNFRFNDVGPGKYLLAISGPTISPIGTSIAVANSDLDLGSYATQGRGSVCGVVYEARMICEGGRCWLNPKRGVWAFADGEISFQDGSGNSNSEEFDHLKPIFFKTDENGRFRVDDVPIGMVSVNFPFPVTADIIDAHSRNATVLEGKATEVRFFDTSGDWEVACNVVVGDGSPAHFLSGTGGGAERKVENVSIPPAFVVELVPKADVPASFCASHWEKLDEKKQIYLRDVHPGKYRLLVGDRLMGQWLPNVFYEKDIEIGPRGTKLTIPLGAGCITGAVQRPELREYLPCVIAAGMKTGTIRLAQCNGKGDFCARYLPDDRYVLFAHAYDEGWCRLAEVAAGNKITDIGSHGLVPGGSITGKLPPHFATDPRVTVVASDPNGIPIESPWCKPVGESFTIAGLWPGKWTITLRKDEEVISRQVVLLQGTETVSCNLVEE